MLFCEHHVPYVTENVE